jgi:serine protease
MKTWIIMCVLCFAAGMQAFGQEYRYFYQGKAIPMVLNTQLAYLLVEPGESRASIAALLPDAEIFRWGSQEKSLAGTKLLEGVRALPAGRQWAQVRFKGTPMSANEFRQRLKRLQDDAAIAVAYPYFQDGKVREIGMSEFFVVKTDAQHDANALARIAASTRTHIVGQDPFMADWHVLACDAQSQGNPMEMAEYFLKVGHFSAAQPDLLTDDAPTCVNDLLYPNQWAITNTGQNGWTVGVDIKACAGWSNWTTGNSSVIIAILDQGYEENHPDLVNQHSGLSYDSESNTIPAQVLGSHGTACAGIAAAQANNGIGVTGVAPDCRLMNISNSLQGTPMSRQARGAGINWAWQNGAAVISNSWGSGVQYAQIDNAITNAIILGRGGLGTVVCFSSGNGNGPVAYPANSNPEIVAVGAASPCGERKNPASCDGEGWGSSYGAEQDVVAPGVKVPTTDRQGGNGYDPGDYAPAFNGTSAACPHVAGLVGLIVSMNPCLTHDQIENILERTAQKIGPYAYVNTMGRPNGTWNSETGYGLINVDEALRATRERYVQDITYTTNTTEQVFGTLSAGYSVTNAIPFGDVNVTAGTTVDFYASTSITLAGGFNVLPGAAFNAVIIPFLDCVPWDETAARLASAPSASSLPASPAPAARNAATWSVDVSPNPVHDLAKIDLRLSAATPVQLELYDAAMQKVRTVLPQSALAVGVHRIELDANALPAGIYFLRVRGDGWNAVRKIAVLH